MLKGTQAAILRDVTQIAIHDQPYVHVAYSPQEDPSRSYQARVGLESVYSGMATGDRVVIYTLMNVVTKIEPSGDGDA